MLQYLMNYLNTFLGDEDGQDLIEYALIIVLIVIVAIVGMTLVGDEIAGIWTQITTALSGAAGGGS